MFDSVKTHRKLLGVIGGLLLAGSGLILILWIFYPALLDKQCMALLSLSRGEAAIPLPADCTVVAQVPEDAMVNYLERERKRRGLIFKNWITCKTAEQPMTRDVTFMHDPHWLPSYVPNTYQFRRTVIVLPYGQGIPTGSPVVAQVNLVPWRKYVAQIAGQCSGKFSIWK
jgi:hypothetical protein